MQRFIRDNYVNVLDPSADARLVIESGEEVIAETWDAFMGTWAAGSEREILGPVAGPIAVKGAEPGDALKVEILDIRPVDLAPGRSAMHNTSSAHGFLKDEFNQHHPTVVEIRGDKVLFPGGIEIPLNPSVGFIATTYVESRRTTSDSGPYGGDIDMKELISGSTIWLPVFVPDGMLCLGDVHAVVGDGCVGGTAAECSGEIRFKVSLEKNAGIERPRVLTPLHLITVCYGENVGEAMRQAVRDMVNYLTTVTTIAPYDAYALLSLAGDVRINRTFRPISPVKMMLSRQVFEQLPKRPLAGR